MGSIRERVLEQLRNLVMRSSKKTTSQYADDLVAMMSPGIVESRGFDSDDDPELEVEHIWRKV